MENKEIDETNNGQDQSDDSATRDSDVNASILHQFNELRSEYLDARSKSINRWLSLVCIVLIFFTILIPIVTGIAAYVIYDRFGDLQDQMLTHLKKAEEYSTAAKKNATDAAQYLKEIKEQQRTIATIVTNLTSKDFSKPEKVAILNTTIEEILQNPAISLKDKAIIEAYKLQNEGNIPDAIEKWRSIANTAKGINDDLVARAFFSIGFLHSLQDEKDQAISAYDQAIGLMPSFADAFNSRGVLKRKLGNLEEAIDDHTEAIRLKPDFSVAYVHRGMAKGSLNKHEEAILDFDKAISLAPDSPVAYTHRGISKNALSRYQSAVSDYDEAIRLKPDYVDAYINRSAAKRALGDNAAATVDMDKAFELAREQKVSVVDGGE